MAMEVVMLPKPAPGRLKHPASHGRSGQLTLLTFNTWGSPWRSQHYGIRLEKQAEYFRTSGRDLDVVFLQDVASEGAASRLIAAAAEAGLAHSASFDGGVLGSGLLVLSRFPITEVAFRPFDVRGDPGELWEALAGKGVGYVRALLPGGAPLHLLTTHLHANPAPAHMPDKRLPGVKVPVDAWSPFRVAQLLEAVAFMRPIVEPAVAAGELVFVGGCWCAPPDSLEMALLAELLPGLRDAWVAAGHAALDPAGDTLGSMSNVYSDHGSDPVHGRVDGVVSNGRVVACETVLTRVPHSRLSYSDHHGVLLVASSAPAAPAKGPEAEAAAAPASPGRAGLGAASPGGVGGSIKSEATLEGAGADTGAARQAGLPGGRGSLDAAAEPLPPARSSLSAGGAAAPSPAPAEPAHGSRPPSPVSLPPPPPPPPIPIPSPPQPWPLPVPPPAAAEQDARPASPPAAPSPPHSAESPAAAAAAAAGADSAVTDSHAAIADAADGCDGSPAAAAARQGTAADSDDSGSPAVVDAAAAEPHPADPDAVTALTSAASDPDLAPDPDAVLPVDPDPDAVLPVDPDPDAVVPVSPEPHAVVRTGPGPVAESRVAPAPHGPPARSSGSGAAAASGGCGAAQLRRSRLLALALNQLRCGQSNATARIQRAKRTMVLCTAVVLIAIAVQLYCIMASTDHWAKRLCGAVAVVAAPPCAALALLALPAACMDRASRHAFRQLARSVDVWHRAATAAAAPTPTATAAASVSALAGGGGGGGGAAARKAVSQ